MRTANLVDHCNVRRISTAFRIRAATARAAHILRARTQIKLSTGMRGAPTAKFEFLLDARADLVR